MNNTIYEVYDGEKTFRARLVNVGKKGYKEWFALVPMPGTEIIDVEDEPRREIVVPDEKQPF